LGNIATAATLRPIDEIIKCEEWQIDEDGKMMPMNEQSCLLGLEPIRCTWRELPDGIIRTRHLVPDDIYNAFDQIKLTVTKELRDKYVAYSE